MQRTPADVLVRLSSPNSVGNELTDQPLDNAIQTEQLDKLSLLERAVAFFMMLSEVEFQFSMWEHKTVIFFKRVTVFAMMLAAMFVSWDMMLFVDQGDVAEHAEGVTTMLCAFLLFCCSIQMFTSVYDVAYVTVSTTSFHHISVDHCIMLIVYGCFLIGVSYALLVADDELDAIIRSKHQEKYHLGVYITFLVLLVLRMLTEMGIIACKVRMNIQIKIDRVLTKVNSSV